jgi:putative redox protein
VSIEVATRNIAGQVTALGTADQFTLVVDRPIEAGGGGCGFNGGQLLYLAIAGCVSNDLFREAMSSGVALKRVVVRVTGDFVGSPAVSTDVAYDVEISGSGSPEQLRRLVQRVDRIAEIPNSLRSGMSVELRAIHLADDV